MIDNRLVGMFRYGKEILFHHVMSPLILWLTLQAIPIENSYNCIMLLQAHFVEFYAVISGISVIYCSFSH